MIQAPKTFIQRLKYVGPSVIVVGSVVGSGELVLTSLLGAAAGFAFLWWVIFSTISKSIVQAEIARYVIVTKKTFLESFSEIPGPSTEIGQKKIFLGCLDSAFWGNSGFSWRWWHNRFCR